MAELAALFSRFARSNNNAPYTLIRFVVSAPSHIGAALGIIAVKRCIRLKFVRYSRRGTATSATRVVKTRDSYYRVLHIQ